MLDTARISDIDVIRQKVIAGERITSDDGLFLLKQANLLDLAPLAQNVRLRHNPESVVTFVIDTNLNYTNICDAYCNFCAFYRRENAKDSYSYTVDEVMSDIQKSTELGITTVLLQGGLNPKIPLEYYGDLVRETRRRFPDIHPHFFSAPEIMKMSQVSGLTVKEVLQYLKEAGLNTIPGGGSEILVNRIKHKISRLFPKGNVDDWTRVHLEAHDLGYRSTATMMYGHVEEDEDIIEHLDHIRNIQDSTGGFTAFIPWSYKPDNTALGRKVKKAVGPNRYLRIIATARIYLDNIQHIQASWFSEGKKTGQVALHFGGDDFGGTIFEENVMQEAGFYSRTTVEEITDLIRDAGFLPAQRTTLYDIVRMW